MLIIRYPEGEGVSAGDQKKLTIENIGGIDTTYSAEKASIADDKGVIIYQESISGSILAGEKKGLVDIQIPAQVVNGPAVLNIKMKDNKTAKIVNYYEFIEIKGLFNSICLTCAC